MDIRTGPDGKDLLQLYRHYQLTEEEINEIVGL